jgi:hypothetical protein
MTATVVFSLLLLALSPALPAQPVGEGASGAKSSNRSEIAEIQGCLQRDQGFYILVDANNEYQRLSDNKNLKKLVGHEVRLTGTPEIRTIDTTPPGAASSVVEQHYFKVTTVQDVSPNCRVYGK